MSQLPRAASEVDHAPQGAAKKRSRARSMVSKANSGRKAVFRWASGKPAIASVTHGKRTCPGGIEPEAKAHMPPKRKLFGRIGRRSKTGSKSSLSETCASTQIELEDALPENVHLVGWLYLRDQWRWRQRYCVLRGQVIEVCRFHVVPRKHLSECKRYCMRLLTASVQHIQRTQKLTNYLFLYPQSTTNPTVLCGTRRPRATRHTDSGR
jgi:hypothetical protein